MTRTNWLWYSKHCCSICKKYFNADLRDLADPGSNYTRRVVHLAVRLVVEDGLPYRSASWHLWRDHRVFVPWATIQNWVEATGKKAEQRITADYLDSVLADFSGYIAADELYDGPFCVLSIVDNHTFKRLVYEVLEHNPTHEDMIRFFRRFRTELDARAMRLLGITTDGSPLHPEPLALLFPGVAHQLCEFHILKEITRELLKAVTRMRRELKAKLPKLQRGRPSSMAKKAAGQKKKQENKIADLFEHRYLFVQHSLSCRDKKMFSRITRGLPHLRNLRLIMEQVYRLFDRRCRTETALEKLARLRRRIQRFKTLGQTLKKLFTPNIEKALTFLDDSQLPSTSNAVERGNRRHRKMQKSIYCVRTQGHISQRVAMDMQRDEQAQGRFKTTVMLHQERNGTPLSR